MNMLKNIFTKKKSDGKFFKFINEKNRCQTSTSTQGNIQVKSSSDRKRRPDESAGGSPSKKKYAPAPPTVRTAPSASLASPNSSRKNTSVKKNIAQDRMTKLRENIIKSIKVEKSSIEIQNTSENPTQNIKQESNNEVQKNWRRPNLEHNRKFIRARYRKQKNNSSDTIIRHAQNAPESEDNNFRRQSSLNTPVSDKSFEARKDSTLSLNVAFSTNASTTSINNSTASSGNDSMEWEPIDEQAVLENIKQARQEVYSSENSKVTTNLDNTNNNASKGTYIVVDSNIFISDLSQIKKLMDTSFPDIGYPVIYTPWMVIQELDYIKNEKRSIAKAARSAIQFINVQLESKHPQFKVQTAMDASQCKLISKNPDDVILCCCMQLLEEKKVSVVLLTKDMNLRNKALINDIRTYDITKIFDVFLKNEPHQDARKVSARRIELLLKDLLNFIIEQEMYKTYGDIWRRMQDIPFPFTLDEALDNLLSYWVSIYSFHLQKQCKQLIGKLKDSLKRLRKENTPETLNHFIEHSLSLCIYLKLGYDSYIDQVVKCINGIREAAES